MRYINFTLLTYLLTTGSARGLLKSAFNAENFMCRLSWSI